MFSPCDLSSEFALSLEQKTFITESREALRRIINDEDDRLVLIVGPCSIHDEKSTYEYADNLCRLAEEVSDKFFLIMRTYFEKPRTKKGWKGFLYDPTLDGKNNIQKGLVLTRKILLSLAEKKVPAGCELLDLMAHQYYDDLLTWGCIGARTTASQPHRQLASSLSFPIGFKNATDGNIDSAINSLFSASIPHSYLSMNFQGKVSEMKSSGNPFCHLVLRGGDTGPNYEKDCFQDALKKCQNEQLREKILIDCSHDNSRKNSKGQITVFNAIVEDVRRGQLGILGMMLESHLEEGSQPLHFPLKYGVSITDPCLSWPATRELILQGAYQFSALSNK